LPETRAPGVAGSPSVASAGSARPSVSVTRP
jgi:hypothetical protein